MTDLKGKTALVTGSTSGIGRAAATTVVVLASANHFVLDATAGAAIIAAGLLATRRRGPGHAPAPPRRSA